MLWVWPLILGGKDTGLSTILLIHSFIWGVLVLDIIILWAVCTLSGKSFKATAKEFLEALSKALGGKK